MHDYRHIRRLRLQAGKLCRALGIPIKDIAMAIYYHNLTDKQKQELDHFLMAYGYEKNQLEKLRRLETKMERTQVPTTQEEKVIHDCHILEGGKYFFMIRTLIADSHDGKNIQQTLQKLEEEIIPSTKCYLPLTREKLKEQHKVAKDIIAELRENLPI